MHLDELVDILLDNEKTTSTQTVGVRKRRNQQQGLKYITEAEWINLGCPMFGYSTAKIDQFEKGSEEYLETYLDYATKAILYNKLVDVIGWHRVVDNNKVSLCKQEIERFRQENNITRHDIRYIIEICHNSEYNRNSIVSEIRRVQKKLQEIQLAKPKEKRKDYEVKIPQNAAPKLYFINRDAEASVADILDECFSNDIKQVDGCLEHPNYKGLRIPRNGCEFCKKLYDKNKASGIKEQRKYD